MKIIKLVTEGIYLMGYNEKNEACYYYPLTKEAKELDLLELPPFKDFKDSFNVTEWAKDEHKYNHGSIHELSFILGCEVGYEKAQSDKRFSLEDMEKAIEMAREDYHIRGYQVLLYHTADEIIESVSFRRQLPKEFVLSEGRTIEEQIKNGYYIW